MEQLPHNYTTPPSQAGDQYLKFVRLSGTARTPFKGSAQAAGFDLYASEGTFIKAKNKAIVATDLIISVPEGTYGRIAPRSGLAAKNFIDVGAGVIDADYRGPLNILLFNHSDKPFKINIGDRIAQLICEKIVYPKLLEVQNLDKTERGASGYGSSGLN
jgi:dUTP pyrophosphatase